MADFVSEFLGFLARATVWLLSRTLDILCACLLVLVVTNPFYWPIVCADKDRHDHNGFKATCVILALNSLLTWVTLPALPM